MNGICRDIFRAVHEGRWLSIEYKNKEQQVTRYWIGIKGIDLKYRSLLVDGLHLGELTVKELSIYIDSIVSSAILDGTYCPVNQALVRDIRLNPEKYRGLFDCVPNLQILNYLCDCNRLDATPYRCEYTLVQHFDGEDLRGEPYYLSGEQFAEIVKYFQYKADSEKEQAHIRQLALNVLSVNCRQGLYVLAYRRLDLDVKDRSMRPSESITLCHQFKIEGDTISARQFLDADDLILLEQPEKNLERIKNRIAHNCGRGEMVDDMPYVIAIGADIPLDLRHEYNAIINMYQEGTVTAPIRAFFGDILRRPVRRKAYPIALVNRRVNLDQLLAINNAMKYPLAYIQGPPGTGKTNTILNTIMTAFFNQRTVLFSSYNNHPIDGVFEALQNLRYHGQQIPFPMIRLGNLNKASDALNFMRDRYEQVKGLSIYNSTLDKNHEEKVRRTQQLTALLTAYEEILDLRERKEVVERLLSENHQLNFQYELRGKQLADIDRRLQEIGDIRDEDALKLLTDDEDEFLKYLYFTSARYIKRLGEPSNEDLLEILYMKGNEKDRVHAFHKYLSNGDNVKKFLRIFPVVSTTCISAHRIGEPKPYFDMVIIDEASQCNTAMSLVPILRGNSLMLVGDPQQLSPVILLDEGDNRILRNKYGVSPEYDYIENSIYKTYLACDSVSDEVLLSYHYRCSKQIIEFNNRKYYNGKLHIRSAASGTEPLIYVDVKDASAAAKNTAPGEVRQILEYVRSHREQKIGIITPFANQKRLIDETLRDAGFQDIACGTVHAFQGDEKDVILFSLGITDGTGQKTYDWLKNHRELINVATSRAKERLILLASDKNIRRLHGAQGEDDLYELVQYVKTNGVSRVTQRAVASRALGVKPYSTETESAFLECLNHAIGVILPSGNRYTVHKEVPVSQVFQDNPSYTDLFYTGRFDFVVYERITGTTELPVLAIELDGKEHLEDEAVRRRDAKKNAICREHGFELIRVDNSYARRYHYIKDILIGYFTGK